MEIIMNSQDMNYVVSKTKLDNLKKAFNDYNSDTVKYKPLPSS